MQLNRLPCIKYRSISSTRCFYNFRDKSYVTHFLETWDVREDEGKNRPIVVTVLIGVMFPV